MVEARQLVATVKIINFAVPASRVEQIEAGLAGSGPILRVAPFRALRAGLIQTRVKGSKTSLFDKAVDITRGRMARIGATLGPTTVCDHTTEAITDAIREMADQVDLLLLIGASAIMDRRDVIPSALLAAGGRIERLGMPVDPGNLTLLGSLGDVAVVAMPGSARSPRLHGTDWILERIAASIAVTDADIAGMGVGGLLLEIPSRPAPRDRAKREDGPAVAAIVLAAGRSSRMGGTNKLLEPIDDAPMIRRTVDTVCASKASPVVVVTGRDEAAIADALDGLPVTIVHNPAYAEGLNTSLKAGVEALPADIDAAAICLGDMPALDPATLDTMIEVFAYEENGEIVVPTRNGRRGNPVLWSRRFFPEMAAVSGDRGARTLLTRYAAVIAEVEVDDPGILLDLDTPDALDAYRRDNINRNAG
jgi:molybdenum cofactor cytidylyltransferase